MNFVNSVMYHVTTLYETLWFCFTLNFSLYRLEPIKMYIVYNNKNIFHRWKLSILFKIEDYLKIHPTDSKYSFNFVMFVCSVLYLFVLCRLYSVQQQYFSRPRSTIWTFKIHYLLVIFQKYNPCWKIYTPPFQKKLNIAVSTQVITFVKIFGGGHWIIFKKPI